MQPKKTPQADLERGRPRRLAVGFGVGIIAAIGIFSIPFSVPDELTERDLQELLSHEAELPPLSPPEEMTTWEVEETQPQVDPSTIIVSDEVLSEAAADEVSFDESLFDLSDADDDAPELAGAVPVEAGDTDEPVSFRIVQDLPQFPGGPTALMRWLTRQLRYPPLAQQKRIEGRVVAEFIVERDGSLTDIHISQPLYPLCDNEALRVLRLMPRWSAGTLSGHPCRTRVSIPIVFRL